MASGGTNQHKSFDSNLKRDDFEFFDRSAKKDNDRQAQTLRLLRFELKAGLYMVSLYRIAGKFGKEFNLVVWRIDRPVTASL